MPYTPLVVPQVNWSNAIAKDYHLLLRNGIQTPVPGVMSETQIDIVNYDNDTYRDDLDASYVGRQWAATITTIETQAPPTPPVVTVTEPDDKYADQSDAFTHTQPRYVPKVRTRFQWWSATGGTGNVIAEAWCDQFISLSPTAFVRF